jgi:peptidyl-tRNA hydrolase
MPIIVDKAYLTELNSKYKPSSDFQLEPLPEMTMNIPNSKFDEGFIYNKSNPYKALQEQRARKQGFWGETAGGLIQSVGEIVGGTLEGVGYLGDIPQTVNALKGTEQEWGNWLSDIGKSLKTWTQEAAPVYQHTKDIGKFQPWSYEWWMTNLPSISSTLSLLIPTAGVAKGASMLGKAMKISGELGKEAQLLKAGGSVLGQAAVSRLMENGMEASETFKRTLSDQLAIGISPEEAKRNAGIAASDDWNKNWLMLAQDVVSFGILGSTLNKAASPLTKGMKKFLHEPVTGLNFKVAGALTLDAGSEGVEEVFQYIVSDRATKLARAAVDDSYEYHPTVKGYLHDQELISSFALGALGSTVFQTAGRKINDAIQRLGGKATEEDTRIKDLVSWSAQLKLAQDAVKTAKESGNAKAAKTTMEDLAVTMAAVSSELGNAGKLKETLQQIHDSSLNPETATALNISPEQQEFIKENFQTLMPNIDKTINAFETYAKQYGKDIASRLALNDNKRIRAEERLNLNKKAEMELEGSMPRFKALSIPGQQIVQTRADIKAKKQLKAYYEEVLAKDETLTKEQVKELENKIKNVDSTIELLNKNKEDAKVIRTPEEAKSDLLVNYKSSTYNQYVEAKNNVTVGEALLHQLDEADQHLRDVHTKRSKVGDTSRFQEPDLTTEKPTTNRAKTKPEPNNVQDNIVNLEEQDQKEEERNYLKSVEDEHEVELLERPDKTIDIRSVGFKEVDANKQAAFDKLTSAGYKVNAVSKPKIEGPKRLTITPQENTGVDVDFDIDELTGEVISKPIPVKPPVVKNTQDNTTVGLVDTKGKAPKQAPKKPLSISTFMNMYYDKSIDSPLSKFLKNIKSDIKDLEITYSLDTGEFFDKEFGKEATDIKKRIASGDKTLLHAGETLDAVIDRLPIKATVKNTKTNTVLGDTYIYKTKTSPIKLNESATKALQQNTRILRQKVVEGLLDGKIVTIDKIKRSNGHPDNQIGEQFKVPQALNINSATAELSFADRRGAVRNSAGEKIADSDTTGGAIFISVTSTNTGVKYPIRLNPKKLSVDDAELVFDLYEKVVASNGTYNIETSDRRVKGNVTVGQALNLLHYGGKSNTEGGPKNKRIKLDNNALYYGADEKGDYYGIDMSNFSREQKLHFIEWASTNLNYPISKKRLEQKIENAFTVGSFSVNSKDIEGGYSYKQLYLDKGYVTTDVQYNPETGTTNTDVDIFIEFSDVSHLKFNDRPSDVKEQTVGSIPLFITKDMKSQLADLGYSKEDMGKITASVAHSIIEKQTTKQKEQPNTEGSLSDKKADIERRRNEDIDKLDKKRLEFELNNFNQTPQQFKAGVLESHTILKKFNNINKYYDAELAALENKPEQKEKLSKKDKQAMMDKLMGIRPRAYTGKPNYVVGNIEEEVKWIKQNLPSYVDTEVVDKLIDVVTKTGTIQAFGSFKDKVITLYNKAEIGTGYHEAFHAIMFLYLTPAQQESVLNEASKKYGIERSYDQGKTDQILYHIGAINAVEYALRSIPILESDKAKQVFDKGNKNNWDLNKILTELAIPKEQKQLLLDLGIKDREQLAVELASKYSYSVEVKTAKQMGNGTFAEITARGENPFEQDTQEDTPLKEIGNTSYYSNLTVPGGTNYTENEISTPLITPSIKGHAQFSTDNGIGWFRSDEQLSKGQQSQLEDNALADTPFGNSTEVKKVVTKTRRILEVQSDFFQKIKSDFRLNGYHYYAQEDIRYDDKRKVYIRSTTSKEGVEELSKSEFDKAFEHYKEQPFLDLLNKDNNWVTFFIKSIIQDSAKKGYEKVLFPKGETAAKVEGHDTLTEELNRINNQIDGLKNKTLKESDASNQILIPGEGYAPIYTQEYLDIETNDNINNEIEKLEQRKQELKSQGIEKLKPIEAFYEISVGNILKKINPSIQTITDEYGNQWYKYDITKQDRTPILLKSMDSSYYDTVTNDTKLHEKLAEDFRNYMLTDGKVKPEPGAVLRFFRNLYNFIKSLFIDPTTALTDLEINGLYERISTGYFKYATPTKEAKALLNKNVEPSYRLIKDLTGFTATQIHDLTKLLLYQTVELNRVYSLGDIKNIDYAPVKGWVEDTVKSLEVYAGTGEELEHNYNIFKGIIDNFDKFTSLTDDMLRSMNIRKIEESDEDYTVNEFDKHIKESYEYSSRDNMRANMKLFIATIPSDDVSAFTGMRTVVDFDTAWKRLSKELSKAQSPREMMEILSRKEKTSLFYKTILDGTDNRVGLREGTETFKTEFWSTFKKHNHNFVKIQWNKNNKSFHFIDAELTSLSKSIVTAWSTGFSLDTNLFHQETTKPNRETITGIIEEFDSYASYYKGKYRVLENQALVPDLDIDLSHISDLLRSIGIHMTEDQVKSVLEDTGLPMGEALYKFVTHDLDYLFDRRQGLLGNILDHPSYEKDLNKAGLFAQNPFVQGLAEKLSKISEDQFASVVLGPDGNLYYTYAANTFLTDFINELKYDTSNLRELQTIPGHKNSYFIPQILNGADIQYTTFLGFKADKEDVAGYFDLDEEQDYLFKIACLLDDKKDKYVLPTISDKKGYGWLSGLKRINFAEEAKLNEEGRYDFPKQVYDVFRGYYHNEVDRIQKATSDIINAEKEGYFKGLRDNFHFVGVNADGSPKLRDKDNKFTGNGTRHILFNGVTIEPGKDISDVQIRKILSDIVYKELQKADEFKTIRVLKKEDGSLDLETLANINLPDYNIKQSKDKLSKKASIAVYNTVADYTINHTIGLVEQGIMFSMDPAYYKSNATGISPFEDLTKRLSELTAPGDNLLTDFEEDEYDAGVMNKNTFDVFTLQSHVYSSDELHKDLTESFTSYYTKLWPNWKKIDIDSMVRNRLQAFKKVDSTDGQTFISPYMYRQIMVRLGEWTMEKDAAFLRIMSTSGQSDLIDIAEDYQLIMQPLKTVYYGTHIINGLAVPIFDKMSMALLLSQMTRYTDADGKVQRTKLAELYDMMVDEYQPIDMVKFDTATKVGNVIRSQYLHEDNSINKDFEKQGVKTTQLYKNLRRQVITDPHDAEERMVGTQVKKIITQNLHLSDAVYDLDGTKVTGADIFSEINSLYAGISNNGRKTLERQLGVQNGKVNIKALYRMLQRAAAVGGMPYNVIDALEEGVNLDTLPDRSWAEAKVVSKVGKKTIDLLTAGDSFIQMTAYGDVKHGSKYASDLQLKDKQGRTEIKVSVGLFKHVIPNYNKLTFEQKKEWLTKEFEGIGYRIPTQSMGSVIPFIIKDFLPDETGNVVMLPLEFTALTGSDFDIDKLFLMRYSYYTNYKGDIEKYTFIKGNNGVIASKDDLLKIWQQIYGSKVRALEDLKQLRSEKVFERKALKYSGIFQALEENLDISRLFDIKEEILKLGFEEVDQITFDKIDDLIKSLDESIIDFDDYLPEHINKDAYKLNHPKALENRVIDVMFSVLTSEAHTIDTTTPVDYHTSLLKDALQEIDGARGVTTKDTGFNWYTLSNQVRTKLFYIGGKFGIGPFALHNVHQALTQATNVGIKTALKIPIVDKYRNEEDSKKNNLARVYDRHGNLITDWLSALINAHVDIAKDPYIFRLNVTQDTYAVVNYLLRLGFGKSTFYLINQPIVVEQPNASKIGLNSKAYLIEAKKLALKEQDGPTPEALEGLMYKWSGLSEVLKDSGALFKQLKKDTVRDSYWYAKQAGIALAYAKINSEGQKLNRLVTLSRIDGKGYGNTLGQIRSFNKKINNILLDKSFINVDKLFNNTYLRTLKENSIDFIQELYSDLTVSSTDKFVDMVDALGMMVNIDSYKSDKRKDYIQQKLHRELFSSFASNYFAGINGRNNTPEKVRNLLYGETSVGRKLFKFKNENEKYINNPLVKHLLPLDNEQDNSWLIYTRTDTRNDVWTRNILVSAWHELLTAPEEDVRQLAQELIDYAFYYSGFNKRLFSFYSHIPYDALTKPSDMPEGISYDQFIKQLKDELISENSSYDTYYSNIKEVLQNNSDYIPMDLTSTIQHVKGKDGKNVVTTNRSALLVEVTNNEDIELSHEGTPVAKPFIQFNINNKTYIGEYMGFKYTRTGNGRATYIYKTIPTKGMEEKGHVFTEYGLGQESILDNNKMLFIKDEDEERYVNHYVQDVRYVPQMERLTAYTNFITQRKSQMDSRISEFLKGQIKDLQMQDENIDKIKEGSKTATSRSYELELGLYKISPETVIEITGKTHYNSIDDMVSQEAYAIAEGFDSLADFKKNNKFKHVQNFLEGRGDIWVYDFVVSDKFELTPVKESDGYTEDFHSDSFMFDEVYEQALEENNIMKVEENGFDNQIQNENADYLRIIRKEYGEEEAKEFQKALDNYNVSDMAKKLVDKLKECISPF